MGCSELVRSSNMTNPKKSPRKEYNERQVDIVTGLQKEFGMSVRKIAKETGIPKSVIGRWVKDPVKWRRQYSFRDGYREVKSRMNKTLFKKFQKAQDRILNKPHGKQSTLKIKFIDDDDNFEFESI